MKRTIKTSNMLRGLLALSVSIFLCFSPGKLFSQSLSGSLTQDELLLLPEEVESQQKELLERWAPIRAWLSRTSLSDVRRSRPQAALATAYLRAGSWPLAWEYAGEIKDSVWQAKVMTDVARAQLKAGNRELGFETIDRTLDILKQTGSRKDEAQESLVYGGMATLLAEHQQWERIRNFAESLTNPRDLAALAEGAIPLIPVEREELALDILNRLVDFARQQATGEETVRLLLDMADTASRSGHESVNGALLLEALRLSIDLPFSVARDLLLSDVSRHLLYADSYQLSTRVVRAMNDPLIQARALATSGRIIAERRNFEAGLPLIQLARDLLLSFDGNNEEIELATNWIIVEIAQTGQFEDAFRMAARLRDPVAKSRAFTLISLVMIDRKRFRQAERLLQLIPYVNLRALIYAGLIEEAGERNQVKRVDELIRKALEGDVFVPPLTGLTAQSVSLILGHQIKYGDQRENDKIFGLAEEKLQREERDDFARIDANVRLTVLFALRGPLKAQEATREMESLLNALWQFRNHPSYRDSLSSIVEFYLDRGDIEKAFTIAVSIPSEEPGVGQREEDPDRFRREALLKMAVIAARRGRVQYLLRALSLLNNEKEQSETLTTAINLLSSTPGLEGQEKVAQ